MSSPKSQTPAKYKSITKKPKPKAEQAKEPLAVPTLPAGL